LGEIQLHQEALFCSSKIAALSCFRPSLLWPLPGNLFKLLAPLNLGVTSSERTTQTILPKRPHAVLSTHYAFVSFIALITVCNELVY
jgi:hypothetical protein